MSIGGFASYSDIATTKRPFGSFRKGLDDWKEFFKRNKIESALDESRDQIATDIEDGNYNKVAAAAMRAGDEEMAAEYAKLRDEAEARNADVAYQNAQLDMERDKIISAKVAAEEKAAADATANETALHAAEQAILDLKKLAEDGDITKWNNESGGINLFGQGGKNIGKRQAALAALLPYTNYAAKKSGGSGINTLGEMMAYLGVPEDATSSEIMGALPGVARKLGMEYLLADTNGTEQKATADAGKTRTGGGGMAF